MTASHSCCNIEKDRQVLGLAVFVKWQTLVGLLTKVRRLSHQLAHLQTNFWSDLVCGDKTCTTTIIHTGHGSELDATAHRPGGWSYTSSVFVINKARRGRLRVNARRGRAHRGQALRGIARRAISTKPHLQRMPCIL